MNDVRPRNEQSRRVGGVKRHEAHVSAKQTQDDLIVPVTVVTEASPCYSDVLTLLATIINQFEADPGTQSNIRFY